MPRTCTVCSHAERATIDTQIVASVAYRTVADRFGLSKTALLRHADGHVAATIAQAHDAAEVSRADDLLAQVRDLERRALEILGKAERANDSRNALGAIREARACLELLAKLLGQLSDAPQVNVLLAPEWVTVRAVIMQALAPHTQARADVTAALVRLDGAGTAGRERPNGQ